MDTITYVGLDVHKATVVATVRVPAPDGGRRIVTETFGTGWLFGSSTFTLGGIETAVPPFADWLLPALMVMVPAGVEFAVNVTGDPVRPADVAVSVCAARRARPSPAMRRDL